MIENLEGEIWKNIVNSKHHAISNKGRVKVLEHKRWCTINNSFSDYNEVTDLLIEFSNIVVGCSKISEKVIYHGKISEIPEELAISLKLPKFNNGAYRDFKVKYFDPCNELLDFCLTAKESIQSACNQEYCIIYKSE